MRAALKIFENYDFDNLEHVVSEFLRIEVHDIVKIYFKQETEKKTEYDGGQLIKYDVPVHTCYLVYVPKPINKPS